MTWIRSGAASSANSFHYKGKAGYEASVTEVFVGEVISPESGQVGSPALPRIADPVQPGFETASKLRRTGRLVGVVFGVLLGL